MNSSQLLQDGLRKADTRHSEALAELKRLHKEELEDTRRRNSDSKTLEALAGQVTPERTNYTTVVEKNFLLPLSLKYHGHHDLHFWRFLLIIVVKTLCGQVTAWSMIKRMRVFNQERTLCRPDVWPFYYQKGTLPPATPFPPIRDARTCMPGVAGSAY